MIWLFGMALAFSQESVEERIHPGTFYGFWEVPEPAGDSCIIIIKRGGRLSCFWTGISSSQIMKGTWIIQGSELIASWENNQVDVIRKVGENAIERRSFEPGQSIDSTPLYLTRGVRVDSRIPGSLTTDTEPSPEEESPAFAERSEEPSLGMALTTSFAGFWKVEQPTGFMGIGNSDPVFYLHLARNGKARNALRSWNPPESQEGVATSYQNGVIVEWSDGRRDLILPKADGQTFEIQTFKPKKDLTASPDGVLVAEKVPPTEASRYFEAGGFSTLTATDIRGTWIPLTDDYPGHRLEIEGWGNAYRYPALTGTSSDPGKWRLQNDKVIITWLDGSKDILRIGTRSFVRDSYLAEQLLTDTPFRSMRVTRVDATLSEN